MFPNHFPNCEITIQLHGELWCNVEKSLSYLNFFLIQEQAPAPRVVKAQPAQVTNATSPRRRPTQTLYTPKRVLSVLPTPPSQSRALYTPLPTQALYAPPTPPTSGGVSQDVRCSGQQTQLKSIFASGGINNHSNKSTPNVG